jgi:hypothetical protein
MTEQQGIGGNKAQKMSLKIKKNVVWSLISHDLKKVEKG